ncbi:F-box domain-containing protein [Mycena venus]|uniref:F-box domain-containing protein n=1 Tax=Mycena venus TaxID=2733690 RepID=A0A8H6XWI0_9AGAR|nr:F-box domain-containing protein [Mycena venus]
MPPVQLDALATILPAADQSFIASVQALRSPEVTATHSGPPHLPSADAIAQHFGRIVARWEPHPFTPQERQAIRLEGLRYLVIVRQIEEVQRDIYPRPLPAEVAAQLKFARQSYMLRYFRIFRINELPTEIISNILRFVVWDSMKSPVNARLRVTWTCKRWREIALGDSTLWNAIWFRGSGARIDRAWAWFERARQAPLDVRIDGNNSGDDSDDESEDSSIVNCDSSMTPADMRQMLLRLFTKLATIRMLIIVVDDWKSALVVLELLGTFGPSSGVPMLQRFELHRGGMKNEDRKSLAWPNIISQPFIGGVTVPSLAYLSLNGVPIDWSRSVLENLTTFDIRRLPASHSPDAARFREVLMNCPRLQKLSMDGAGPRFEEDAEGFVPVELPHLRTLVVADFSRQYSMFLFSQFSAPNVNDLTLMNLCGDDYLPLFLQLTGAFPKVRLLTAYSIQFEVSPHGLASMTRWLDSMPLLAYLRVANVATQFFGIFFRPNDLKTPVSPRLLVVDCQSVDPDILVRWKKDRQVFGTPLHKIYISEDLGARLKTEQIKELTTNCILAKLPRGATTPEEEALTL